MTTPLELYIVAVGYLKDVEILTSTGGLESFNVSSWIDNGSSKLKANVIDKSKQRHPATGATGTIHFALGHAMELFLKSILLSKGVQEREIYQIGHDLERAVKRLEEFGVDVPEKELILSLSKDHEKMGYRYPKSARVEVLIPGELIKAAYGLSDLAHGCLASR